LKQVLHPQAAANNFTNLGGEDYKIQKKFAYLNTLSHIW